MMIDEQLGGGGIGSEWTATKGLHRFEVEVTLADGKVLRARHALIAR